MTFTAILLALLIVLGVVMYFYFFCRYVAAEPNEWMLIMRNGQAINCGVGISQWVHFGDKVVRFPSKISKVNFSAQQVTKEVQGVEINGALIWSVFREKDGPLKAFRYLGEDLKNEVPVSANAHLVEISNAIVRHRIANSTIDEILRNRDVVRNEIRNEMNKLVNGWGVWLESVEITDVKILSGTLFSNLQTPFREEQRIKAELIRMNTESFIREKQQAYNLEATKLNSAADAVKTIFKSQQNIKVVEENQKNLEAELNLKKQKAEAENLLKKDQYQNEVQFTKQAKNREQEVNKKRIDRQIELEAKRQEVMATEAETKKLKQDLHNERKLELEHFKQKVRENNKTKINEIKKKADFRFTALKTATSIYKNMPIDNMKLYTFGTGGKDPVNGFVDQLTKGIKYFEEKVK